MSIDGKGEYIQLQITFSTRDEAERLANDLVVKRLAACGQVIGPIYSFYHWNNELCHNNEWLLLAKTRRICFDKIMEFVTLLHSYQCPQIVALPIEIMNEPYRQWLNENIDLP